MYDVLVFRIRVTGAGSAPHVARYSGTALRKSGSYRIRPMLWPPAITLCKKSKRILR